MEKSKIKNKHNIIIPIIMLLLIMGSFLFLSITRTQSVEIADGSQVEPNSDLIYYINVTYDGKDKNAISSSDTKISEVYSGTLHVEDVLPNDVSFKQFLGTDSGSIGAVQRANPSIGCVGQVINDEAANPTTSSMINSKGLHYYPDTRVIEFNVRGLQAGCQLTVGVVTQTAPTVDDPDTEEIEVRRDIYNTAFVKDRFQMATSNTTHAWMGFDESQVNRYTVSYEYDADYPFNPDLPAPRKYTKGGVVSIATEPYVDGYRFTGWTVHPEDASYVTITSRTFKMPAHNIRLIGHFEEDIGNKVTYEIQGDAPTGYSVPRQKIYATGSDVKLDSTSSGTIINGFKFLGWTVPSDVTVTGNMFTMPDKDIKITGRFERVKHKVTYAFSSSILPPNSASLLPAEQQVGVGTKVTLPTITNPTGYEFLGWQIEDNFIMPDKDITIYGEWCKVHGKFTPSLSMTLKDGNSYYQSGDTVKFNITVTNNESYPINDVQVRQNNDIKFITGTGYELRNESVVKIPTIPANSSITILAEYLVTNSDNQTISKEVEIIGASISNDNVLDTSRPIKASASFTVMSKIKVCNTVDANNNKYFTYHITGSNYDTWISLVDNECRNIFLDEGSYKIQEVVPQEYNLSKVTVNGTEYHDSTVEFRVEGASNIEIEYNNQFRKKGFYHSAQWLFNKLRGGHR